jgi:hypothetical protein
MRWTTNCIRYSLSPSSGLALSCLVGRLNEQDCWRSISISYYRDGWCSTMLKDISAKDNTEKHTGQCRADVEMTGLFSCNGESRRVFPHGLHLTSNRSCVCTHLSRSHGVQCSSVGCARCGVAVNQTTTARRFYAIGCTRPGCRIQLFNK